ncbi:hypothetical protein G7Z99_00670 [Pseudomonas entomophila]|uniref:phage tail assembly chaperone n=1 Tax=Pseudomonas entomophila TaxID=312306 RepID=UPI0015E4589E|nr:phage tail assembly chaperone [Pseudomonas entomophila]MBA1187559.1 hypothetical protein [Pseudomonas entomophila]
MNIYLVDTDCGELQGPVSLPVVPGLGPHVPEHALELERPLPPAREGHAWALVAGQPREVEDHRGPVYSTETGAMLEHRTLGPLPDDLTSQPWPGPFHVWTGDGWKLDAQAKYEAAAQQERDWRSAAITASDYLVMPDYPITAGQRSELYAYRQALRDWPSADAFPDPDARPSAPAWLPTLSL